MSRRNLLSAGRPAVVHVRRDGAEQLLGAWVVRQLSVVLDVGLPVPQRLTAWRRVRAVWAELKPRKGDKTDA